MVWTYIHDDYNDAFRTPNARLWSVYFYDDQLQQKFHKLSIQDYHNVNQYVTK